MKTSFRWVVAASVVSVAIGFAGGAVSAKAAGKKEIVQWTLSDLKWKELPNTPGVQQAELYKKGATMQCMMVKFPKGTEIPTHTHTNDIVGVVVAGTFGSTDEAGNGKPQPPGTFQNIPGGLKHTTKCTAEADCTILSCLPGAFDLKMAKAPGEKKG